MRTKLFTYAVIFNPSDEQAKAGQKARILVEPKNVLAVDEKGAAIHASREIPAEYLDQLDQVDVVVRPF